MDERLAYARLLVEAANGLRHVAECGEEFPGQWDTLIGDANGALLNLAPDLERDEGECPKGTTTCGL